jgi:hypothetical protein
MQLFGKYTMRSIGSFVFKYEMKSSEAVGIFEQNGRSRTISFCANRRFIIRSNEWDFERLLSIASALSLFRIDNHDLCALVRNGQKSEKEQPHSGNV